VKNMKCIAKHHHVYVIHRLGSYVYINSDVADRDLPSSFPAPSPRSYKYPPRSPLAPWVRTRLVYLLFVITNNQKEQCPENTGGAVIPFERFQIFFYDFSDMRSSVVMKKNNFIMSLLVFRPFFHNTWFKSIVADTDRP